MKKKHYPFIPIRQRKSNRYIGLWLIWSFICLPIFGFAQSKESRRFEIDAKRVGITYTSKEALPQGREFKRIDSTYYVGWMLEGTYKFDHAADYRGYDVAAQQLEKAMQLLQKDFYAQLQTRTTDVQTYVSIMKYHRDWDYMAFALMQCYSNMENPSKVWRLLQQCKKNDLQDELYMDTYNYLAWTVHRNRFYTSAKYPFLKNTIAENEQYANTLLDSCSQKIKRDAQVNKTIFNLDYLAEKMPSVWHYKSILYSYQLKIESAAYYYDKLRSTKYFPENNYATFCAIQANFREAEHYYDISKMQDPGDKRMKESYYYLSIINAYKGNTKAGIQELKNLIKASGSTPGFGWYNIALTRDLLYDGQIDIAKRYALRAEQFKEIHIGTTLGQSHYDFSISLMNLLIKIREIESIQFLQKDWWYSPAALKKMAQLTLEKYSLQFLIINQFATNPERDRVIYNLFSTESTVSFDEIWYLIDGFSVNYFLDKFQEELKAEKRENVKRYEKLFTAKLYMKKEKFAIAKTYLESILQDTKLDVDYEKLFLARVATDLLICKTHLDKKSVTNADKISCYKLYPQLIPFSTLTVPMRLHSNENNDTQRAIIQTLKSCSIQWVSDASEDALDVDVQFKVKAGLPIIQYSVKCHNEFVVPQNEFTYSTNDDAGKNLCFYLFKIGNDDKEMGVVK